MLTKEQDEQATRLRDAGVPGDIAVFLASRLDESFPKSHICAKAKNAAWEWFWWTDQPEGDAFWEDFDLAYSDECRARGIK